MDIKDMPAFPTPSMHYSSGLTKREIIAAMCLQALLSNPSFEEFTRGWEVAYGSDAVKAADALLSQLANKDVNEKD